jgi:hypothetical protein
LTNTVDAIYTVLSLNYGALGTVGSESSYINSGSALNLSSTGGNALFVGTGAPLTVADSLTYRVFGPGTLTVTNPTGVINSSQGGPASDHFATLDFSGLTNFSAVVSQIFVGCIPDISVFGTRPMGIMRLADNNYVQTGVGTNQPGIVIAGYPTGDTNLRGTQQLFLGRYNVINCDALIVGATKSTGQILMRPGLTGGTVILRGSAGGTDKVKVLSAGDGHFRHG